MKPKVLCVLLSSLSALTLVLSACGPAAPAPAAPTVAVPAVAAPTVAVPTPTQQPLQLTAVVQDFYREAFDPVLSNSGEYGAQNASAWAEQLIQIDGGKVVGKIAERWEEAPDGLSWTFYIRKGIKFQNGDDLTAADVKFSFERFQNTEGFRQALAKSTFTRIEVVDDYTVRIYTDSRKPYFLYSIFGDVPDLFFIMPKNYIEKNGVEYYNQHPIGSGPYKVVGLVPGDKMEFEAWDGYWGTPPKFHKFTMLLVPEEATAVAMLEKGQADVISRVSFDTAMGLKAKGYDIQGFDPYIASLQFWGTQMPQIAKYPTRDPNVRLALSLAINREEIKQQLFGGEAGPGVPMGVAPWMPGVDYDYWVDYSAKKYVYDPEKAKQLIKEAGYPEGFTITLIRQGYKEPTASLCDIVAGYWAEIGVTTNMVNVDAASWKAVRDVTKSVEGIGVAWIGENGLKPQSPGSISTIFSSQAKVFNILWNGKGSAVPELDDMINAGYSAIDKEQVQATIRLADETGVVFPISTASQYVVIGPRVNVTFEYPDFSIAQVAGQAVPK